MKRIRKETRFGRPLLTLLLLLATDVMLRGQEPSIPDSERQALIAVFESLNGEHWFRNQNWLGPPGSERNWQGVTVENGHVTGLTLAANGIDGQLPPQIGDLAELRRLDLCSNPCTCALERESISPDSRSSLQPRCTPAAPLNSVRSGLPESIASLSKLEVLDLDQTGMTGNLPAFLGDLSALRLLRLNGNDFEGPIPESLGGLSNLQLLELAQNRLSGQVPSSLEDLQALQVLDLGGNDLEGEILAQIAKLGQLRVAYLHSNRFAGEVPGALGETPGLEKLSLSSNAFSGRLPAQLAQIGQLAVDHNALHIDPADRDAFGERAARIEATQTLPPTDLLVEQVNGRLEFRLRWRPILYAQGPGAYLVQVSEQPEGPFETVAESASKGEASLRVGGLSAGQGLFFRLRTRSDPNIRNDNLLLSRPGAVVSGSLVQPPPPARYYLPELETSQRLETGLSLVNLSDLTAQVTLTALGPDGVVLPLENNPADLDLPPDNHRALQASELFGSNGAEAGWIEAVSDNPDLGALFLLNSARLVDGTSASIQQSRRLFFTEIAEGPAAFQARPVRSLIQLVNPNRQAVQVTLRFKPEDADQLEGPLQAALEIAPSGFVSRTAGEFFQSDLSQVPGYVEAEVTQGPGLIGSNLVELESGDSLAALPAFTQAASTRSYAAQVVLGGGFSTSLTLADLNPFGFPGITLRLYDENGLVVERRGISTVTGQPVHFSAARTVSLASVFDFLDPDETMVATLLVETTAPEVIGNVIISYQPDSRIRSAVAFPLRQAPLRRAVFGQIASNTEIFSGLALFNPGPETAEVVLQAFAGDGSLLGEKTLSLDPLRRTSQLLRELLPESGQLGGYLRLSSSSPIVAEEIIGDFRGQFMSAVPPFVIE